MLVKKVAIGAAELGDPASSAWARAHEERVELTGTPLGLQPSPYVVASRQDVAVGTVKRLRVKSLHNGSEIALERT